MHGQAITVTEERIYAHICVSPLFTCGLGRPSGICWGKGKESSEKGQYCWSQGDKDEIGPCPELREK